MSLRIEGAYWVAESPMLPRAEAFGKTRQEALDNFFLSAMLELGTKAVHMHDIIHDGFSISFQVLEPDSDAHQVM